MKKVLRFCVIELIFIYLFTQLVLSPCIWIPTGSMSPTIPAGSLIAVCKDFMMQSGYDRGDIILFYSSQNIKLCKRIIALGGETIEIRDGVTYIDGTVLNETYAVGMEEVEDFGPYTVPEDSFFCMGDNRLDSMDSRYWDDPAVSKEDVVGKAVVMWFENKSGICWKMFQTFQYSEEQ